MTSVTATEARAVLPDLLTKVEHGEEVTITRHGRPVAVLVRPDALRSRRASDVFDAAAQVHELITHPAVADPSGNAGLSLQRADELVRAIRADRDAG
jgi:prevent-host-death family protein